MLTIEKVRARLAKRTPCSPTCKGWEVFATNKDPATQIQVCDECNQSLPKRKRLSDEDVAQLPEAQNTLVAANVRRERSRIEAFDQVAVADAKRHGEESEPEMEVGDLQGLVFDLWKLLPHRQKEIFAAAWQAWDDDADDRPDLEPEAICADCGSPKVSYAAWYYPNTGEVGDGFGSPNEADATFCDDCEATQIVHRHLDPEVFAAARAKFEAAHRSDIETTLPACPKCGHALRLCAAQDTACAHCDHCDWCGNVFEGVVARRVGTKVVGARRGEVIAECPDAITAEHVMNALNGDTDE